MSLPALTPHSVHCTLHLPPVIVITQYCAAVALADVSSANIVGYNTVTLKPGWNMLAVNFKNVGNDDGISIQELLPRLRQITR